MKTINKLVRGSILILIASLQVHAQTEPTTLSLDILDSNFYKSSIFEFESIEKTPAAIQAFRRQKIQDLEIKNLAELRKSSASLSESYNASGYYDLISIRGIPLDPKSNILRNGLPIIAESPLFIKSKYEVQILKGPYGFYSGVAHPGGLVNLLGANENTTPHQQLILSGNQNGQAELQTQVASVLNEQQTKVFFDFYVQKNKEEFKKSEGHAGLFNTTILHQWTPQLNSKIELEYNEQSQPSRSGWSLLGASGKIPDIPDKNINLNNASWTLPVVFKNIYAYLGNQFEITDNDTLHLDYSYQQLKTDDRIAYANGCAAENIFDRFCSDGTFDVYDFRSENEKRENHVGQLKYIKKYEFGQTKSTTSLGLQSRHSLERYQNQAYNYAGTGNINGELSTTENSLANDPNTNRDWLDQSIYISHQTKLNNWGVFGGIKSSTINRKSIRTNNSRALDNTQISRPAWVGLSYEFENWLVYASHSEGIEFYAIPNKNSYDNPGADVSIEKSKQIEVGVKSQNDNPIEVSIFQIQRPHILDQEPFYGYDGEELFQGLELNHEYRFTSGQLGLSALILDPKIQKSVRESQLNDKSPTNVSKNVFSVYGDYSLNSNWKFLSNLQYQSSKYVTSDNRIEIPALTVVGLATQWNSVAFQQKYRMQFRIDNLFDQRGWKETPTMFSHIYMYPQESRTFSMSIVL